MYEQRKNVVLISYITVFTLIIPAIFWFSSRQEPMANQGNTSRNAPREIPIPVPPVGNQDNQDNQDNQVKLSQTQISLGEKILITADNSLAKQVGVKAFANGDYATASAMFNSSLETKRNDPETWIYLNNAIAAVSGEAIKIGASVPISSNLNVAKEILRGVAQAQYEVNNSGGVDGKLVMVEIADDHNDPEIAKQVAAELVNDSQILAVIGHNDSNASIAAAPVYQQGGLVMITPTSSAEIVPEIGSYIFRTTSSTRALGDRLAQYAVEVTGRTNIAVCSDSQAQVSKSFEEEFIWAVYSYGGKITSTKCDFSAPDFNPNEISSQAISDGADALLLAPSVRKVDKAIEVAKANQKRLTLLGNHSMNTYAALQQGQVSVDGMVLVVPWHPEVKSNNSFVVNAKKLWGGGVNWRTAMAYDAAKAAFVGAKLGSTREQLQQTMSNSGFSADGASSTIKFLPSGDRHLQATLLKVEPGSKSGTGYDFVPFQP